MNQDKAREFFSAYYEGTLESGLRQSLESRLRSDAHLQTDYAGFVGMMQELADSAGEQIEAPAWLSDRIATRLEQEMARRPSGAPFWSVWLRGVALAGLGAAAIAGAIFSFHSSGPAAVASSVGPGGQEQPSFSLNGTEVVLNFRPAVARTVVVSSAVNGRELQRFTVDAGAPAHSFQNSLAGTALFQIQIAGEPSAFLLALPGTSTEHSAARAGAPSVGTVRDLAVALADDFRLPVVLHADNTGKRLSWRLEGSDPSRAASAALGSEPYVADLRENGVLYIGDR